MGKHVNRRMRRSILCCSLTIVLTTLGTAIQAGADAAAVVVSCTSVTASVSSVDGGPADLQVSGRLCRPQGLQPRTVQLLVHGATYTKAVWDWPQNPATYSYVQDAVTAGYATFSVDRVGHGASTHPASGNVTIPNAATALHGVVTQLRNGTIAGFAFTKVVWVGHSLGAVIAYDYGGRYDDITAYLMIGSVHFLKQSWLNLIIASLTPTSPDPGYLTTTPGSRTGLFYYAPTADPAVIAQDEALKDTITNAEVNTALPLVTGVSAQSPTQGIDVPVMIAMGQFDNLVCGGPDGMTCTPTALLNLEQPYFPNAPSIGVTVVGNTGHMLSQHPSAPATHALLLVWIHTVAAP
jgi:pimeloyl-ACP methyl ester carboxylesterase